MVANGKWLSFKGKLDPFLNPPDWQAKVEEMKSMYIGLDVAEMAREFAIHRNAKHDHEECIKVRNIHLEALSQLLVENLETSELQKIQLATGETVYINAEPYASVGDRSKVMAWINRQRMQAMLTVQWQSLNALVKERLIAGQSLPPGVKVFLKTSARLRGGT